MYALSHEKQLGFQIKTFQEICLKASRIFSKKFAQLIAHFIPYCKVETSVKSERKSDKVQSLV